MCKIVNIMDRIVKKDEISWDIEVSKSREETIHISRLGDGTILIIIFMRSFERLEAMKQ